MQGGGFDNPALKRAFFAYLLMGDADTLELATTVETCLTRYDLG